MTLVGANCRSACRQSNCLTLKDCLTPNGKVVFRHLALLFVENLDVARSNHLARIALFAGVAQWLESEFSKLVMRVRSPSPALIEFTNLVDSRVKRGLRWQWLAAKVLGRAIPHDVINCDA